MTFTGATQTITLDAVRDRLTITVEEAGALLGLGRASAYKAAGAEQIPTIRIGRRLLVPVAKFLRILEG